MARILLFKTSPIEQQSLQAAPLDPLVAAFQARCFERFKSRHVARGLVEKYSLRCLRTFEYLLLWCQKSLLDVEEADYEAWCQHLAMELRLKQSTQRTYQKGVRQVIKYLHGANDLQNEAMRDFGHRISLFAHSDNSIVHTVEDESAGRLRPMSHEEITRLFKSIDANIEQAVIETPRTVRALCRDKVVIYVMYLYGLRVSEVGALQFEDWRNHPDIPECGDYAYLSVRYGKGAKGSGKRHRLVPTTDVTLVDLMIWYRKQIRPLYKAKPGHENQVFLSEHGVRLSGSSIQARLALHLEAAGFERNQFSPHSLRRAMVTHELMRAGFEFVREKAGHQSARTTQIYGQVPLDHTRHIVRGLICKQLRDLKDRSEV